MGKIRLSLKDRSYDIIIRNGSIKDTGAIAKRLAIGNDAFVVSNKRIWSLYGRALERSLKRSGINVRHTLIQDSEKAKSFSTLASLLSKMSLFDTRKRVFLIALGGGVIGDLAGFAAAIYKRGIPYLQIPTTLLAQVDSAIGGKTAIDLPVAKNLVGAFYQPKAVLSDISTLRSLPERELRNGLAEVIKYGVIKDRRLFEFIEKNYKKILRRDTQALSFIVARSSAIKARVVETDERDTTGARAILNYGHTFGHAIEAASEYGEGYYHGEAIAVGMIIAARLAVDLGLMKARYANRIEDLIRSVGLPTKIKKLPKARLYNAYLRDKKFIRGESRLVLPTSIGSVKIVHAIPDHLILRSIARCTQK